MNIRKITVVIGIAILAGAIVLGNILSDTGEAEEAAESQNNIINVASILATSSDIESNITFTGTIIPEEKIDIFSEVGGVLTGPSSRFKAGAIYNKGDILIQVDDSEFRQSLNAQRSRFIASITQILADINLDYPTEYEQWSTYVSSSNATDYIEPLPEAKSEKFKLFLTGRNIYSDYFGIKQNENRLSKYTIRAPYDGVVTSSSINVGTLVRVNQNIGEFIKNDSYEIEASINVDDIPFVKVGDNVSVNFTNSAFQSNATAEVVRINSTVNASTQTVLVYLKLNESNVINGAFVEGNISGRTFSNAQRLSSSIFVRDNMIFTIVDSVATLKEVKVIGRFGDSVIIEAIDEKAIIVNEFRDAVFEGTKVAPIEG